MHTVTDKRDRKPVPQAHGFALTEQHKVRWLLLFTSKHSIPCFRPQVLLQHCAPASTERIWGIWQASACTITRSASNSKEKEMFAVWSNCASASARRLPQCVARGGRGVCWAADESSVKYHLEVNRFNDYTKPIWYREMFTFFTCPLEGTWAASAEGWKWMVEQPSTLALISILNSCFHPRQFAVQTSGFTGVKLT